MNKSHALSLLANKVEQCTKCTELVQLRTDCNYKTVPGDGNADASIFFLGEGPGSNEAQTGKPFVGRAGVLLGNIIKELGYTREEVYIANILKCRPPNNRNPTKEEADNCRKFLDLQIQVVNPQIIVCLGSVAATNLLNEVGPMSYFRSKQFTYRSSKVIVTYHPAYCLRNPKSKADVWHDLKHLKKDGSYGTPQCIQRSKENH